MIDMNVLPEWYEFTPSEWRINDDVEEMTEVVKVISKNLERLLMCCLTFERTCEHINWRMSGIDRETLATLIVV